MLRGAGTAFGTGPGPLGIGPSSSWSQMEIYESVKALAESEGWPLRRTGGFSSRHPAGCDFLFCDGAVHILKPSIDQQVYRFLGNRDDGEALSADSF